MFMLSKCVCVVMWNMQSFSSCTRWRRVEWQTYCWFCLMILAASADPTLVVGPRYLPKVILSSGNAMVLALSVVPVESTVLTDVCGPPFHKGLRDFTTHGIYFIGGVRADQALSLNKVIPKTFWGVSLDHFAGTPTLSLQIQPSAACCQGGNGSVWRK